jgi:hypothetical protein
LDPATTGNKVSILANLKAEETKSADVSEDDSSLIPDFTRSSDEEEEQGPIFTPEYCIERKELHEKEMRALHAEMPPPTLQDHVIVKLLQKIQLLGMIADGSVPEEPEPSAVELSVDHSIRGASSVTYKRELDADEHLTSHIKITRPKRVVEETITVDSLPFLNSGPPTPLSDLDVYQENLRTHERIKNAIREELAKQREEASLKNKHLREEFIAYYRPWRLTVREMDHKKDMERKASTPGTATPPAMPPVPPVPEPREGRPEGRRYKGNSELDFQNALRASAISAQEESERRRRMEATTKPDLNKEAVIPDMLEPYEAKAEVFKDTNNIIDPVDAFAVYGFDPPADDFTPEEHKVFTDAFMAYPKKWGKIAEELPGRNFQECIMHYYLTKEEIKYKAKLNKRWTRKGRTRRSARPKSNALMADLNGIRPDDGDEETVPVTDTGRPRRAAAPTFGGESAADPEVSRRNGVKDIEQGEKPPNRRGGRTGPGSRGGRRGRGGQQQQQQQQQHAVHPPSQPAPTPQAQPPPDLYSQQPPVPASTATGQVPLLAKQEPGTPDGPLELGRIKEPDRDAEDLLPRSRSSRTRGRDAVYVFEGGEHEVAAARGGAEMGYGSMQPTSYWSVPEVRDFPVLLAHFGRDFEGVSNFMKTKTPIMVSSYFLMVNLLFFVKILLRPVPQLA